MKYPITVAALAAGSHALVARDSNVCCFHLTASGGAEGPVDQLSDGQLRIKGDHVSEGVYCIDASGGLTDSQGRGCILTPPTTQLQCDAGATPSTGFTIDESGFLSYKGTSTFHSCPVDDKGQMNIYSENLKEQPKCVELYLIADDCLPEQPQQPEHPQQPQKPEEKTKTIEKPETKTIEKPQTKTIEKPQTKTIEKPKTTTIEKPKTKTVEKPKTTTVEKPKTTTVEKPKTTTVEKPKTTTVEKPPGKPTEYPEEEDCCPGELGDHYTAPHLITRVDCDEPGEAYHQSSFNVTAGGSISSVILYDVPKEWAGKPCHLEFMFPTHEQLETSSYEFTGDYKFNFAILKDVVSTETTYDTLPEVGYDFGTVELCPGTSVVVGANKDECPAGETIAILMSAVGDSTLNAFVDSNPCPIGPFLLAEYA